MDEFIPQALAVWRRHDDILRYLLDQVPRGGMAAVPSESRGRDVARQFAHLYRVRKGWLHFHQKGGSARIPRFDKGRRPTKVQVRKMLRESGKEVEEFLGRALRGEARIKLFGRQPLRWLAYLIAHESHHRGQICLALKQAGMRLPDEVAVNGLWGKWIHGK